MTFSFVSKRHHGVLGRKESEMHMCILELKVLGESEAASCLVSLGCGKRDEGGDLYKELYAVLVFVMVRICVFQDLLWKIAGFEVQGLLLG